MRNYFDDKGLLGVPTKRAAYSDRMSYLMAEMSRLAYFKFEGGDNVSEMVDRVKALFPGHRNLEAMVTLIRSQTPPSSEAESRACLSGILGQIGFSLVETFSDPGTGAQAFLCKSSARGIAVLAFRGTEPSLKDIKADIKARLASVDSSGTILPQNHAGASIRIHSGYLNQFNSLREDLKTSLAKLEVEKLQLFITGHSLGGALAITAVKFLASDITGACYTFGSPPVGTKNFEWDIKTPIYRIINHVDIVPRLPNPTMVFVMRVLAIAIGVLLGPFVNLSSIRESKWYDALSRMLLDAQKYRPSGYGSYLVGEGQNARLRRYVGPHDKLCWWIKQFRNFFRGEFKLLSDHSIDTYSKKLAVWANKRL